MTKLLKVIMEFEDKIQTLEGEEAQRWLESINSMCVMEHVHGRPFPTYKWKIEGKKK
jgi:hypothetical protein